jgi:hypothetical protein
MSNIIRRLHAAYGAASQAGIEMREWRLSTTAYDELIAAREAQSLWIYGDADKRTLMGLPVLIERKGLDDNWAAPTESEDGTREIPADPIVICMSGIGKRGRWEYFDA